MPLRCLEEQALLRRQPQVDWIHYRDVAPARLSDSTSGCRRTECARSAAVTATNQYPLVPARINDRLDTLLFLDTGMPRTGIALPMSTTQAANVDVLVDAEGIGYCVQNTLSATPIVCASVSAADIERRDLGGMLLARFRLEHQFGFRIGGLLGDGFSGNGRLRLDFAAMRVLVD